LLVLLTTVTACGGKATQNRDDQGQGGATMTGGSAVGGQLAGGRASSGDDGGGTPTTLGGSTAGTSATAECDDFSNQTGPLVSVTISNKTAVPLYLGPLMHGCSAPLFDVTDSTGAPLRTPICRSCQDDFVGGTIHSCLCPAAAVFTLQPGEATLLVWSGAHAVERTPPIECWQRDAGSTCSQIMAIEPGEFTFTAQAATAIACELVPDDLCNSCTPLLNGGCYTLGAVLTGPRRSAQTTVILDESYGVGPSAGADGNGNAAPPRSVEITFAD
jgi:hypothetical protein